MSRALIHNPGTGGFRGAAGVKAAKLCREQDQIGRLFFVRKFEREVWPARGLRVRSLEVLSNVDPREMAVTLSLNDS